MPGTTASEVQGPVSPSFPWGVWCIPALGLLLLGAHFWRNLGVWYGSPMVALALLCLCRRAWGRLVCAVVLLGASLLWVHDAVALVTLRQSMELPWYRLAAILGGVSMFSLLGAGLLLSPQARVRFSHRNEGALPQAATFFLVAGGLWLCREKAASITPLLADRFVPGSGLLEIALVAVYAAEVCGLLLSPTRARRTRPVIWALFSVVFFGQLALGVAGVPHMLMTGALHLPVPALIVAGPLYRGAGLFMLVLFAISVLLVGPAWCSHLCYVGAWDDMLSRVGAKRRGRRADFPAPEPLPAWTRYMRWGIALGVFGTALGLRYAGASLFVAGVGAAAFGLAGIACMVWGSARKGVMLHCATVCPLGLMGNLFARFSPWRLRITKQCTMCGACRKVCRYNALPDQAFEQGKPSLSCSLCRDCLGVCTHGAMELRFAGFSPRRAGAQWWGTALFAVLVTSLHAIFLAVARM